MDKALPVLNRHFFIVGKVKLPDHNIENKKAGNQIFHYCSENTPVKNHNSSYKYVQAHFQNALEFESDASILFHAAKTLPKNSGLILEFGVCSGKTTNFIAALNPFSLIYGFDSFKGIPEDWERVAAKDCWGLTDQDLIPPLLTNIKLVKGVFEETLPNFAIEIGNQPISLIHIDCDLYSSTKGIFQHLAKNIVSGTYILFDEYFNYDGWENHEHKAFMEFISASGYEFNYIAYNKLHQQVLIQIK